MKLNSPLPQPLPKECIKAAKILRSFVDSGNNGLDGKMQKGFAIFTIFKAGFLFSARAGSGVVIAKLPDGSWSAPSAIGTAGLGVGGQLGAEMTDFLVVLNSRSKSFMAAGSLTLGGNASIAVGPLGRNGEASGSLNSSGKVAAMYSYSKTRGLFGGISIEGSVIVERQDANAQAYKDDAVTAKLLLSGSIESPPWASTLVQALESCTGMPGTRQWINDSREGDTGYAFGGLASPGAEMAPSLKKSKKGDKSPFPPASNEADDFATSNFGTRFESDYIPDEDLQRKSTSSDLSSAMASASISSSSSPTMRQASSAQQQYIKPKPELTKPLLPHEGVARAIALYDFNGVERGDLSFKKGEVIVVTQKSESTDDWWTGKVGNRAGIFPANFTEVV
ncbi:DUF500-domain-containing protein [Gymnopus androsaceus JB14]|uniref:DUF500-domain-containing protein n=1 Tax=Gymnopus androsaceus JB14 TaxID=1447944 RepID=A0A6A4HDN3_9AGAR|nr:DUF500-domain-containing protein [Gymnopus androsaceus JB14]